MASLTIGLAAARRQIPSGVFSNFGSPAREKLHARRGGCDSTAARDRGFYLEPRPITVPGSILTADELFYAFSARVHAEGRAGIAHYRSGRGTAPDTLGRILQIREPGP